MKSNHYPLSRQEDIVIQELKNEILIYDLKKNKAFCLNQTSALVWQNCDGRKTVAEIAQILGQKFRTQVSEDLVWLAIDRLKRDDLLTIVGDLPDRLTGIKRREVIRKIGLTTMMALPVVSSVVAPRAVEAQSVSGDPFCSACPSTEPLTCQNGSYVIGCFATGPACTSAGFESGGSSTSPNHCCHGAGVVSYDTLHGTGCCTVGCKSDPSCLSCPSAEPATCQNGGNYSIGCFPTQQECVSAGFDSGGTSGAPNHCCNGAGVVSYDTLNGTGCCIVGCNA